MNVFDWLKEKKKKSTKKRASTTRKKKATTAKKPVKKQESKPTRTYNKPYTPRSNYKKPYVPKVDVEKYRPRTQHREMFENEDMEGIGFHGGTLNLKPQPKPKKEVEVMDIPKPDAYIHVNIIRTQVTGKYPVTWKVRSSSKYNRMWFNSLPEARGFAASKAKELRIGVTEINSELVRR